MTTKILADFQICISVPLTFCRDENNQMENRGETNSLDNYVNFLNFVIWN